MPEIAENSKPTDVDIAAAFQTVFGTGQGRAGEPEQAEELAAPAPVEVGVATEAEQTTPSVSEVPADTDAPVESEDVVALRAELAAVRAERDSVSERSSKNLEWSRGLGLRKASEADRLRVILKQIADGKEVDRAEVERVLAQAGEGIPQLAPVTQPFMQAPPQPVIDENAQLEAEQFVTDYRLNDDKANAFKAWMEKADNGLTQRDVVPGSLYHTLALAYSKYERASSTPSPATIQAVKALAKVQKDVARASGTITNRGKSTVPAEPDVDLMKLAATDVEGFRKKVNISDLMQRVAQESR